MSHDDHAVANERATDALVEEVDARAYTVPTDAPEADGTLAWDSTTIVLVRARSGDIFGTGWTYGPAACAHVVRDLLSTVVVGQDAQATGGCFDAMVRAARNAPRVGAVGYAISAVDVALWDLKARLLDLPLHTLLGAVSDDVPVYGSGGFTTYPDDRLAEQLGGWVHDQGIPRVKIKIGESWGSQEHRDLARMSLARRTIGEKAELFVDANGAYSAKQAVRLIRRADDLRVAWFEEPVSSDDLAGLRIVRGLVEADVAAGEYGCDLPYFARMVEAGAVDCLQVDASRCGGITEFRRAAAVAAAYGLDVSGHCAPHLHASVAAATSNLRHLEWFHDHVRIESAFFDGVLDPQGGIIHPDRSAPGHGLTLREPDLDQYRVA